VPVNPLAIEDVRVTLDAIDVTVATPEGKVLLDRVTFSLPPSSVLAVVGPSGAGKSTLTNALNGFAPATSGQVLFDGHDLYASYDVLRRRIGYVPQQDILHPQLTVRRALQYAAELRFPPQVSKADKRTRIKEVLDELDLSDRADLRIERLSGGQRKRVSVALELLTKPSLLFLDEPTSGLDPGNERQVMALLRDLANAGRTIIVVTHSTQSLHLCDRVMFLAPGGKVSYFGPPVEALAYFKRHDAGDFYADVFTSLEERPGVDWAALFRSDPDYQRFVAEPLTTEAAARPAQQQRALPPAPQQSWMKQFSVLTRRYVALIASDRRYSLLLLLQAPILGAVLFLLFGPRRLSVTHGPEATVLILALVIGATWLGMLNAIREIVKELPIYQRERSVGLSISAYLASKVTVLSVFTIFQAIVVVGIGVARQKVFEYDPRSGAQLAHATGSFLMSPKPELIIDIALTGLAAMALGLMVSAFARTSGQGAHAGADPHRAPARAVGRVLPHPGAGAEAAQLRFLRAVGRGRHGVHHRPERRSRPVGRGGHPGGELRPVPARPPGVQREVQRGIRPGPGQAVGAQEGGLGAGRVRAAGAHRDRALRRLVHPPAAGPPGPRVGGARRQAAGERGNARRRTGWTGAARPAHRSLVRHPRGAGVGVGRHLEAVDPAPAGTGAAEPLSPLLPRASSRPGRVRCPCGRSP